MNNIGASITLTVKCHVHGKKQKCTLQAPAAQKDYALHFNAVDCNDHDSSDYTTSICTNHCYLLLFYGYLTKLSIFIYQCVCIGKDQHWSK